MSIFNRRIQKHKPKDKSFFACHPAYHAAVSISVVNPSSNSYFCLTIVSNLCIIFFNLFKNQEDLCL